MSELRLSQVSAPRRAFVRECQRVGFGKITGLVVRDSEPVFSGDTIVLLDVKLDSDDAPRPEQDLTDFALAAEVVRFFSRLDTISNGTVDQIEIRGGLPRRMRLKVP